MADSSRYDPRNIPRRDNRGPRQGGPPGGRDRQNGPGGNRPRSGVSGRAAVPWYVGQSFGDAPPGHRYLSYLPFWKSDWSINEGKQKVLKDVGALSGHVQGLMQALAARQRTLGQMTGAEVISAMSTSPFATGLGWKHPNENGFAFLQPYGLPYLPGSSVKGVMRRAAKELALFGDGGLMSGNPQWTMLDVWWLFGFEGAAGAIWEPNGDWADAFELHKPRLLERADLTQFLGRIRDDDKALTLNDLATKRRDLAFSGVLRFFDVIPELSVMDVDIMNPHYGRYYQGDSTPHDAGNPIPVFFLVVPPGSKFTFVVDCPRERHLPPEVAAGWRELLRAAFAHAFDWLGFGAKTAVGYGAMEPTTEPRIAISEGKIASAGVRADLLNAPTAASDTKEVRWEKARVIWEPGPRVVTAAVPGEKPAYARGKAAEDFLKALPPELRTRLEHKRELNNMAVMVEVSGNQRTLKRPQ